MGTALLPARDFLAHYQSHTSADFMGFIYPKRYHQHPQSNRKYGHAHGFSPQKSKVKGENPEKKRSWKPKAQEESFPEVGKRAFNRIHKVGDRKFGHVDDQTLKKDLAKNPLSMGQVTMLKRGQPLKPNNNDSSKLEIADKTTGPLFVSPTQFVHQDPTLVSEKWAGPAFASSPSPSSLPLPSFSIKKSGEESPEIDRVATRDLRRLLGLD